MMTAQPKALGDQIDLFTKEDIGSFARSKVPTGFQQLDTVLGGGLPVGLTVLGAITGLGKSTLMLQIAENISSEGTPVLYFSLEMPISMITAKAMSRQLFIDADLQGESAFSANALTQPGITGGFDDEIWSKIAESRKKAKIRSKNLFIEDFSELIKSGNSLPTAQGICDYVANYVEQGNKPPLIIVDYLQILQPEGDDYSGSDKQIVDNSIRKMSKLSEKHEVPVVLVSSLNRKAYEQKVQLESFKESGGIEYTADVVIGLSFSKAPDYETKTRNKNSFNLNVEKAEFKREVELTALKQRYGSSGANSTAKMYYYAEFDLFQEAETAKSTLLPLKEYPASGNVESALAEEEMTAQIEKERAANKEKTPRKIR